MNISKEAQLIEILGGNAKVADFLGVNRSAVSNWLSRGIPADKLMRMAKEARRRRKAIPDGYKEIVP